MFARARHIAVLLAAFAVNFGLDRLTKSLAVAYLRGMDGFSLLRGSVVVRFAENSGAFLSLGSGWPVWLKYAVLLAGPALICIYGLYHCAFKEPDTAQVAFLATVIAGGLGNLVDRAFNDFAVVDFLNFGIGSLRTGVLNLADLSITFGAVAYLIRDRAARRRDGLAGGDR